ncbi:MAG: hypothetical protein ABEH43_08180, partial [Flavobacteriales bacterium]
DKHRLYDTSTEDIWAPMEKARMPMKYLASLFTAGDEEKVKYPLKKQLAVRMYRRYKTVGDVDKEKVDTMLNDVNLTPEICENIYYLTSLPKFQDRFVIPPAHREEGLDMTEYPGDTKGSVGFG